MPLDFNEIRWDEPGTEPSESRKNTGRAPGERVPAPEYNFDKNKNAEFLKFINDYATQATDPIVNSAGLTDIVLTTPSAEAAEFTIDVTVLITGANVNINRNGGGLKALYSDIALTEPVTELPVGIHRVYDRGSAFYLAASGGECLLDNFNSLAAVSGVAWVASGLSDLVNVAGSGWLVFVEGDNNVFSVEIDGVYKIGTAGSGGITRDGSLLMMRFETSLKIRVSNVNECGAMYYLGDTYGEDPANFTHFSNRNAALPTLRANVAGEGWIHCLLDNPKATGIRLVVDGNVIIDNKNLNDTTGSGISLFIPFFSDFQFYASTNNRNPIIYNTI